MRLADRDGATTIVTTNFDRLLESAAQQSTPRVQTYTLGDIPRPSYRASFAGVLHIHGVLTAKPSETSDLIVTDQDFGEFYLRRRVVPDFIYDAARLFHLVLVGYSANDPPMRYLLNAVAADRYRFPDLKQIYTFIGMPAPDPVEIELWKGRGIVPIPYDSSNYHSALASTLKHWSELSVNGNTQKVDARLKDIVRSPPSDATEEDIELFKHLFRRDGSPGRHRLAALVSKAKAHLGWLDAIMAVEREPGQGLTQ